MNNRKLRRQQAARMRRGLAPVSPSEKEPRNFEWAVPRQEKHDDDDFAIAEMVCRELDKDPWVQRKVAEYKENPAALFADMKAWNEEGLSVNGRRIEWILPDDEFDGEYEYEDEDTSTRWEHQGDGILRASWDGPRGTLTAEVEFLSPEGPMRLTMVQGGKVIHEREHPDLLKAMEDADRIAADVQVGVSPSAKAPEMGA